MRKPASPSGCGRRRLRRRSIAKRQRWQSIHGAGHIQKLGVSVNVRREVRLTVPHRRLSGSKGDAALAQMRSERGAQSVNIDGAATLILLGDSRRQEVAVQDAPETYGHVEQRHI